MPTDRSGSRGSTGSTGSTGSSGGDAGTTVQDLVVGIDAGGTRTRAALGAVEPPSAACPESGLLATGTSGPGNALSVPYELLRAHLREAVAAAVPAELRPRVGAVAAGLAGCSARPGDAGGRAADTALRDALADLAIRPRLVTVHSDTEVAFAAAPGAPADGLVLIAGTGAVAARVSRGTTVATSDGNGWLLGDAGSGFWIGRRAVRAALAELDGRGAPTLLGAAVRDYYLEAPEDAGASGRPGTDRPAGSAAGADARSTHPADLRERLVHAVHERPVLDLAGLSPSVVAAARDGDRVARRILAGAAKRLGAMLSPLHPAPDDVLVTTGGMLGPDGALLPALRKRVAPYGLTPQPVRNGLPGATALARAALTAAGPGT